VLFASGGLFAVGSPFLVEVSEALPELVLAA
jgi:hypothetical protein